MLRRSNLKRSPLKRVGPKALEWNHFRNNQAQIDQDEEGLIRCEDHKIGLPKCGIAREPSDMDLHHIKGRNEAPKLYYDRSNLVWLTRECHGEAHN